MSWPDYRNESANHFLSQTIVVTPIELDGQNLLSPCGTPGQWQPGIKRVHLWKCTAAHMRTMVLEYWPTKLGHFWGKCDWIFQTWSMWLGQGIPVTKVAKNQMHTQLMPAVHFHPSILYELFTTSDSRVPHVRHAGPHCKVPTFYQTFGHLYQDTWHSPSNGGSRCWLCHWLTHFQLIVKNWLITCWWCWWYLCRETIFRKSRYHSRDMGMWFTNKVLPIEKAQ